MGPEKVNVSFSIQITSNTHNNYFFFSEDWNFTQDRYSFQRVSENEVKVSFSFEAQLIKSDEEHGKVYECPSEYLPEFQFYEEEIETILDILSLKSNVGLQVKEESFRFSAAGCKDGEIHNDHQVAVDEAKKLYSQLSSSKNENDKKFKLALRLYRQSLLSHDPREKMTKLYSALERLFAAENKGLLEKDEIEQVKQALESIPLSQEKKQSVLKRIEDIKKSPKELIVEKMDIGYGDKRATLDDKRLLVTTWNRYRSKISHGEIVYKREQDFDIAVAEIDSIVDSILEYNLKEKLDTL